MFQWISCYLFNEYFILYSYVSNKRACTLIYFSEKCHPARFDLINFTIEYFENFVQNYIKSNNKHSAHIYRVFFSFLRITRVISTLHDYQNYGKCPSCTLITSCTLIRYIRVSSIENPKLATHWHTLLVTPTKADLSCLNFFQL